VVVVATQGHGDEEAVEQAVTAAPAFVGLVASRKRGEAVIGYLTDRGVSRDLLDKVRVPVGLDLGHTSHPEIAVAVLAELVELRAKGVLDPEVVPVTIPEPAEHNHSAQDHPAPGTAIDPVCGMTVTADESGRPFEFEGQTYYFCCPGCRTAFEKNPTAYIAVRG
jgi:xanthine dehydrogenase accessory factor